MSLQAETPRCHDLNRETIATGCQMNDSLRAAMLIVASAYATDAMPATVVRVLDPDSKPLPAAVVFCGGPIRANAVADASGTARMAESCTRVHCTHMRYIGADADVHDGIAECRVGAAVHVWLAPLPAEVGSCMLVDAKQETLSDSIQGERFEDEEGHLPRRLKFRAARPGRYTVVIAKDFFWACEAYVGVLPAGEVDGSMKIELDPQGRWRIEAGDTRGPSGYGSLDLDAAPAEPITIRLSPNTKVVPSP